MKIELWEVYRRDSQECCAFLTKKLAESQSIFDDVDLISTAVVDIDDDQLAELKKGNPIWF